MSYINPMLGGNYALGGVQMALAAAYESRIHSMSKMTVARAQFAGDTAVTLTDGSYNTRFANGASPTIDIPKSATAQLANSSNTVDSAVAAPAGPVSRGGKPLVIKPLRDPFTADIYDYAVFNADGTAPGTVIGRDGSVVTAGTPPVIWNAGTNRWEVNPASRYLVNKQTGEIYVNRIAGIREHFNPDGLVDTNNNGIQETLGAVAALQGVDNVVGMVDFEGLSGGALSAAQQEAANLSTAVQSLTSILRSINENKKSCLSLIR